MANPQINDWTPEQGGSGFYVESMFGAMTRLPFVQISLHHEGEVRIVQIPPDNARELALNLLECAEAAEMDAMVIKFLGERLNVEVEPALLIVNDLRAFRSPGMPPADPPDREN